MKAIVFGGSGFLGSYVVDVLVDRAYKVTIFDRMPSPYRPDVAFIQGDILDADAVVAAAKGADYVYNLAGAADVEHSVHDPVGYLNVNIVGNAHVLEAARRAGANRFVYASSAYALSEAGAFYGASKRASEKVIELYREHYGLDFTILRYGSVYGARADKGNRIYRLLKQALTEGKLIFPGNGLEEREYIHAADAARLSVDILADWGRNETFILTGTERFTYKDLLGLINEILGNTIDVKLLGGEYKGHYTLTPYHFRPTLGKKLISNPCIDFGQGLLACIEALYDEINTDEPVVVAPLGDGTPPK
jgi:UDP-glucose 4-epimerase